MSDLLSNMSAWFVKNSRAAALILISIVLGGIVSYNSLLMREGFPPVQFPIVVVQGEYFVNDASKVDSEVIQAVESAVNELDEVNTYSSNANNNGFSLVVTFDETADADDSADELIRELEVADLPENLTYRVLPIKLASFDGENDFLFSVSNRDLDLDELVAEAELIAEELEDLNGVASISVKSPFSDQVNAQTGEVTKVQDSFGRVTVKEDEDSDDLEFLDAVSIGIVKDEEVDDVTLSAEIRARLDFLTEEDELNEDNIYVYGGDPAVPVNDQISSLEANTISALLVIVVVTLLFINWRAAIIAVIFLPVVLSAVFFGLFTIGSSLNVISLFALILVLGLLVDDIIVVIEALDVEIKDGLEGVEAVRSAIRKIGVADLMGTITTVTVFIPMLAISGILGEFISLIPITVIMALVLSVFLALTVFAWLATVIIKPIDEEKIWNKPGAYIDSAGKRLGEMVDGYLQDKMSTAFVIIGSLSLVVILTFAGAAISGFDVFPSAKDSEQLVIEATFNEDELEIDQLHEYVEEIEDIYSDYEEEILEASYFGNIGSAGVSDSGFTIILQLSGMGTRNVTSVEIAEDLNSDFEELEFGLVKAAAESGGPPSSEIQFVMQLFAKDLDTLESASQNLVEFIETYEIDVADDTIEVEEVKVENLDNVARFEGKRFVELQVSFSEEEVSTAVTADLRREIEEEYDEDLLEELGLDDDSLGFDQGFESDNAESFVQAQVAFVVSLIVMYGILVVLFNSTLQPLLVYSAIPFGLAGVFPGLAITNNPLSFFVFIGIISLAGIVVNNTILLLDYANQRREAGMSAREAIVEALTLRFRPLVTTSVTTVVGLVPLALSDPFWEGLAFTLIFGLIASTTLVVTAFPAYYIAVESLRDRLKGNL